MEYRQLGRTGLQVSEVGFGGAPAGLRDYLGQWDPSTDEAAGLIQQAVEQAVDLGVTYFDSAPGYGDGASEGLLGRALAPYRQHVTLATKVKGADADTVRRSVEQSLTRLRTDVIDVLQYHGTWYSEEDVECIMGPRGALEGMRTVRDEGLVRFIGFTSEGANGAASSLIQTGAFDVLQICYNLLFQHPYEPSRQAGVIFEAAARQMGIVTMRSLTSGIFQKWIRCLDPELERRVDLNAALLSFVLSNPHVSVALVGMRSAAEVEANAAAAADTRLRVDLDWLHTRYV